MTELDTALAAAQAAGAILRDLWPDEHQVRVKGYRDIVTEADVAAQTAIVSRLRADYPDHAILAEEGGPAHAGAGDLCPTWIVDPLDGTTNYAHRLPNWAVSIGLAFGPQARVGVIHDPLRDLTFYAAHGQGAFLRRGEAAPEKLAVSQTGRVAAAVIAVDWAHEPELREASLRAFHRVAMACTSVRTLGSSCLSLACLAAGWLDAYFHFSLKPWDLAGPAAILAEAGGQLTTLQGQPWQVGEPGVVFSNGHLHAELLAIIAGGEA